MLDVNISENSFFLILRNKTVFHYDLAWSKLCTKREKNSPVFRKRCLKRLDFFTANWVE